MTLRCYKLMFHRNVHTIMHVHMILSNLYTHLFLNVVWNFLMVAFKWDCLFCQMQFLSVLFQICVNSLFLWNPGQWRTMEMFLT